ncbi:MAG: zf-HC2 domain-containing protein [Chloroflexi bacterium]|nr:zf-HC2 domain-containing protein [Chloroflexota bacterium]
MFGLFRKRKDRRQELLSAYLDGRLSHAERAAVERLLAESDDGRRELEALRQTVAMLRQLPRVQPTRSFTLTPAMADARPPRPASSGWVRLALPVAASAAAMFLVFTLAGGAFGLFDREHSAASAPSSAPSAIQPSPTQQPVGAAVPAGPAGPAGVTGAKSTDSGSSLVPAAPRSLAATQATATSPAATPVPPLAEATPAGKDIPGTVMVEPIATRTDRFPWLPLQITAGALTGLCLTATLWQFQRARAKRG